jgi:hypothetical protein
MEVVERVDKVDERAPKAIDAYHDERISMP